jgi:alpha-L-rhamnosidase
MTAFSSIATVPAPGERPGHGLRKAFAPDFGPERARADATDHRAYEPFVNGKWASNQRLTPGSTSHNTTLQVQAYDGTALSHPCSSTISAALIDGRYRHCFFGAEEQLDGVLAAAVDFFSLMLGRP